MFASQENKLFFIATDNFAQGASLKRENVTFRELLNLKIVSPLKGQMPLDDGFMADEGAKFR